MNDEQPGEPSRAELGRADLHIHTLASDGVSGVEEILAWVEASDLDVVAITDHERIDAARGRPAHRGGARPDDRDHRGRGDHDPQRPPDRAVHDASASSPGGP